MFDADLQTRFMRSSTDALIDAGRAWLAAGEAWQRASAEATRNTSNKTSPATPFSAGLDLWSQALSMWLDSPAMKTKAVAPYSAMWEFSALAPFAVSNPFVKAWFSALPAAWQPQPNIWSWYQSPFVGMMLWYGVPMTVAAPAARAQTSAMDAANAATEQWQQFFSAYHSEGGYASAHARH